MKRMILASLCFASCWMFAGATVDAQGKELDVLKQDVGTWDCEMKMWMSGPDSDPMVVKGTEKLEMFGGIWQMSEFKADMGGVTFEGRGTVGYDPVKKKYIGTWIDSMNPYMSYMEGTYDESEKSMTMMMKGTGPDGKPMVGKNVSENKDEKTRVFTMFNKTPGGDEWVKSMQITYKKK